jgi:predicted DNA-binding protein
MSKQLILTLSDEMFITVEKLAQQMGTTKLDYIRFLIMKDIETKEANSLEI